TTSRCFSSRVACHSTVPSVVAAFCGGFTYSSGSSSVEATNGFHVAFANGIFASVSHARRITSKCRISPRRFVGPSATAGGAPRARNRSRRPPRAPLPNLSGLSHPPPQPGSDVERIEKVLRGAASRVEPLGDLHSKPSRVLSAGIGEHEREAVAACLVFRV